MSAATGGLPRISVITPSLNHQQFIGQTIESVVQQGYPDLEYWVIDGGSTDETCKVLSSYGSSLNWISEPDAGQADAVNKGLRRASGDIIGWLNSDDLYLSGALETVGRFFEQHSDVAVLYGNAHYGDVSGKILEPYPTQDFAWETFAAECYLCQPSVFFRRQVLQQVGFLDPTLHYCMDYDFWLRLFRLFPPVRLDRFLSLSRMHLANKTLSRRSAVLSETIRVVTKHYGYVPYKWSFARASYLRHRNDQYFDRRAPTVLDTLLALLLMGWYNRRNPPYLFHAIGERCRHFLATLGLSVKSRQIHEK